VSFSRSAPPRWHSRPDTSPLPHPPEPIGSTVPSAYAKFSEADLRQRVQRALGGGIACAPAPRAGGDHELNSTWPEADQHGPVRQPCAVLIPATIHPTGAWVLLTRRSDHLPQHAGQIAFPGGKIGPQDQAPVNAALREAHEEIGLHPQFVDIIGRLEDYRTATGFDIAPFVGIVRPGFSLVPDPNEVAEILQVPLAFLMQSANHQIREVVWRGQVRRFHAMPYKKHYIWGATAGIFRRMYERLYRE
jgi:8-oxo-dGTP pyrophosphatase MutT (NUDIX family)